MRWLDAEGSTRTAGLLRIGLALILWARFGSEVAFWEMPGAGSRLLVIGFYLASAAMLIGLWSQLSTLVTAVLLFVMGGQGLGLGAEPWGHHHVFLLQASTLLLVASPTGRSYSLDRWLALRRARRQGTPPPAERGPTWGLKLIVIQLTVMYLFTALDKTHVGFFTGARMEHYFLWYFWGSEPPDGNLWRVLCVALAWGTILLEYALAFGLPFARTRRYLVWPGLALHAVFYLILPVRTYSATVMLLYLAYADPDRVHRFIDELST